MAKAFYYVGDFVTYGRSRFYMQQVPAQLHSAVSKLGLIGKVAARDTRYLSRW